MRSDHKKEQQPAVMISNTGTGGYPESTEQDYPAYPDVLETETA
jgi:hypothetical protein